MIPKYDNYCGGSYHDWLEVLLTVKCNGGCAWCIEKEGWHPDKHVSVDELCNKIIAVGKKNIMLLGGEPLLYRELKALMLKLNDTHGLNVYLTTNGSLLNPNFIQNNNLCYLKGINISIHHYDMVKNRNITKVKIDEEELEKSIIEFRLSNTAVRLNCNLFNGGISNRHDVDAYIDWAKQRGIENIRFNEMKGDKKLHVKLEDIFPELNLSNDPFINGCVHKYQYRGCNLNLRQMCGIETDARKKPDNPKTISGMKVLYYNGEVYDGWVRSDFAECNASVKEQLIRKFVKEELNGRH